MKGNEGMSLSRLGCTGETSNQTSNFQPNFQLPTSNQTSNQTSNFQLPTSNFAEGEL